MSRFEPTTPRVAKILAALSLLTISACATPLPEKAPLSVSPVDFGARERRDVANVVVVADGSGSMYMAETFPEAKSLAQSFVKALPDASARGTQRYAAGFIGFGGDERVEAALAPFDRSKLASAASRAKIMGQRDGTGGTTPIDSVIAEIGEQLEGKSGKTAVVLFTDGGATDPAAALAAARTLADSRRDPVCFHGVQVGGDAAGRAFLQELAGTTGCGSVQTAGQVGSASALRGYAKNVLVGRAMAPPPPPSKPSTDPACTGTIRLRGIEFAFNKAEIDPVGAVVLDAAGGTLSKCPNIAVSVDGHTDAVGPDAYNQRLSERRANAVRDYLVRKGVSAGRLTTRGLGESQPVADNGTDDGRARNRRVELKPR